MEFDKFKKIKENNNQLYMVNVINYMINNCDNRFDNMSDGNTIILFKSGEEHFKILLNENKNTGELIIKFFIFKDMENKEVDFVEFNNKWIESRF